MIIRYKVHICFTLLKSKRGVFNYFLYEGSNSLHSKNTYVGVTQVCVIHAQICVTYEQKHKFCSYVTQDCAVSTPVFLKCAIFRPLNKIY